MKWVKSRSEFRPKKIYATTSPERNFYLSGKIIWIVIILICLGALIWFLFYSKYFSIKNIEIEGSLNLDVSSEIGKLQGKNIFTVVLGNTEQELAKKQTSIESISIRRGVPDTLKIKVFVRTPIIGWKTQDKIYLLDKNGIAFERGEGVLTDDEFNKLPKVFDMQNVQVTPGEKITSNDFINFCKIISDNFSEKTGASIIEMKIGETTLQLEVQTDQGYKVLFDTTRDPLHQLDALKKVLDQYRGDIKEYIDLRVEGKAYLK